LTFDLRAALRRHKPQRASAELRRRPDRELSFVEAAVSAGPELMLDTCVYLDVLQGRTPSTVDDLLRIRIINHSSVALAELTHAFGRLDPADPRTRGVLREIGATIDDIPAHRLSTPSVRAAGEAGMVAGLIARLSRRTDVAAILNDVALALHANETGCVLLTRNIRDFDLVQQVVPAVRLALYR
jgi:predicted nucleic acid-binding protein